MSNNSLESLLARLHSIDANDRVKAAAELGEVGTPEVAPEVLKAAWKDKASTVRQMAIQSYHEIMQEDAIEEIIRAAKTHYDEYVRLYAISILGLFNSSVVTLILAELLQMGNSKIKIAVLRAMIHAQTKDNADLVYEFLDDDNLLIQRNSIEALARWKYTKSFNKIEQIIDNKDQNDETKTIALFALASFGDKKSRIKLETGSIDEFIRIKIGKTTYRGRSGLLAAVDQLK